MLRNDQAPLDFDLRVLLFTSALSVLTGILFGLVPRCKSPAPIWSPSSRNARRIHRRAHAGSLPESAGGGTGGALAVALIGAGLFVRSLQNAERINPGFETEHMLVLTYDLGQGYSEARGRDFNRRALER